MDSSSIFVEGSSSILFEGGLSHHAQPELASHRATEDFARATVRRFQILRVIDGVFRGHASEWGSELCENLVEFRCRKRLANDEVGSGLGSLSF